MREDFFVVLNIQFIQNEVLMNYRISPHFFALATFYFLMNNLKSVDVSMSFIIPSAERTY
jgi:hypothetical protein